MSDCPVETKTVAPVHAGACATSSPRAFAGGEPAATPVVRPRHSVRAVEGAYEVGVLMPGVKRGDVTVRLDEEVLRVEGRRGEFDQEGWRPLRREIGAAVFRLELEVNVPVDPGRISARLEDGVLSLRLPLREEAAARDIPVA